MELLMGLNSSVMPFATLRHTRTRVFGRGTGIQPGLTRYAINELWSAVIAPLRGRFDIYHPTLYRALPWVRRRRMVVTHHDCIHERFPHLFPDAASIVETKRKLFAQADAILCVSASSQSDLLHFYDVAESKTHVVHHGFSPLPNPPGDAQGMSEEPAPVPALRRFACGLQELRAPARGLLPQRSGWKLQAVGGRRWSRSPRRSRNESHC